MNVESCPVQNIEEAEPDDVVHVQVRKKDVHSRDRRRELLAELANTGPRIENDDRVWVSSDLDACSVSTVRRGLRAGCRK